ncbi:MAG: S9 family peptidase [Betaproteobacteria bacterium]|nr:S9 family peptidase [Betaproteobacteria bacterium]
MASSKRNQSKRLSVELLWKLKRPTSPTLSPDGAQTCVALTAFDMKENKGTTKLWLLSNLGGAPRELTTCGEKDGQPQWSPDGSLIAFVAKRGEGKDADEEPQLYVIPPDGGEARRVTALATGVSAIKWFADSKRIAFISWVWPDLKREKDQAKRLKERKDDKVKAIVSDKTKFQHWDHFLADGRVPRVHIVDVETGKTRDAFAGTRYELPVFDPGPADFDVSPDGRHLAFTFNPNEDRRGDQETEVVEIDLRRGKAKVLTAGSPLTHSNPAYSPDGTSIALLVADFRRSYDDDSKVAVIDRASGKLVRWSAWDRNVNAPLRWAADGKSLYFAADEFSRLSIWRLARGRKVPEKVVAGGTVSEFDLGGGMLAYVRNDMSTPPAVWCADAGGANARPVESFNAAMMDGIRLGRVEDVTVKGWNGEPVQMWVIYPPDFDPKKKWPLVHNIHGGPHASWGDNFHFRWNNHLFAAQGYVVACVNYHGSLGWGNAFLESNVKRFGAPEHADVEAGTDHLIKRGFIDPKRLAATGGSYGGFMVAYMNGRNGARKGGDRYKAYVCHAGCYDWPSMHAGDAGYWFDHELGADYWSDPAKVAAQNPAAFAKHMKTPTLVIHGALDYRVPVAQGMMYYSTLRVRGVPSRLVLFPDENHWILKPQNSRLWYREYFDWLERYVGKGPAKGRK